jgi:outer membrane biosynthesis protein TonB
LAASIASVVAMAGDKIIMNSGSMMMIHKPWTMAMGNADELAKVQEVLQSIEQSIVPIYVARTGLTEAEIQDLLNAETWLTAAEAVAQGFADEMIEPKKSSVSETIKQMLNGGRLALVNQVTEDSTKHLLDKIKSEEAKPIKEEAPAEDAEQPEKSVEEVETETEGTPKVDETETPKAPEINQPAEEESEAKPSEETEEKDTEMSKAEDLQVENLATAPAPSQAVAPAQDYIKSTQAVRDFANILQANAGKEASDVKAAWNEHLVKMGITNPDVLLPGGVVQAIQDTLQGSTGLWGLVNKTGLTVFRTALNTVTGADSRAKGHTKGNEKNEQVITLADRTIRAQFIYKYITLDKETIRENEDTGAVVTYVLSELPKRILAELERAIVIGDGREDIDEDKIKSFMSIKEDSVSGDGYAVEYDATGDANLAETFIKADGEVRASGARYGVMSRAKLVELKLSKDGDNRYIFPFGSNVAGALGFAGIFTPDFMSEDDAEGYIMVPEAYNTVGDNGIQAYTNFLLKTNKQEYLQELYAGGALAMPRAAVAIVAGS